MRAKRIDPTVQIQIHEMEQFHKPSPTKELNYLIDFFDSNNIFGVTWIHLCHLNSNANIVTREQAERYFNEFSRRRDRILTCYSSNRYLGLPHILDDEIAISKLLSNEINWAIGADDPFAFRVGGIIEEMKIMYNHLIKQYRDVDLADNAFKILSKNTWKQWSPETKTWELHDKDTFCEKAGFEKKAFMGYFEKQRTEFSL